MDLVISSKVINLVENHKLIILVNILDLTLYETNFLGMLEFWWRQRCEWLPKVAGIKSEGGSPTTVKVCGGGHDDWQQGRANRWWKSVDGAMKVKEQCQSNYNCGRCKIVILPSMCPTACLTHGNHEMCPRICIHTIYHPDQNDELNQSHNCSKAIPISCKSQCGSTEFRRLEFVSYNILNMPRKLPYFLEAGTILTILWLLIQGRICYNKQSSILIN